MEVLYDKGEQSTTPKPHPLSFITPLLRSHNPNATFVLLEALLSLPFQSWAGGVIKVDLSEAKNPNPEDLWQKEVEKQLNTTDVSADDLFGEGLDTKSPSNIDGPINQDNSHSEITIPPLFLEDQVGVIVSYLSLNDQLLRKMVFISNLLDMLV